MRFITLTIYTAALKITPSLFRLKQKYEINIKYIDHLTIGKDDIPLYISIQK